MKRSFKKVGVWLVAMSFIAPSLGLAQSEGAATEAPAAAVPAG
jgi:hypothetical protein